MAMFEPKQDALQQLKDLGIPVNAAIRGLLNTGNTDANRAAEWCFERLDDPGLDLPLTNDELSSTGVQAQSNLVDATTGYGFLGADGQTPLKLAFIVNSSLGMGAGKIASQVSHATVDICLTLQPFGHDVSEAWLAKNQKAVVLQGRDGEHLRSLAESARRARIAISEMRDAGLTQVAPGSLTVLGLYGGKTEVDAIIGGIPLLQ